MAEDDFELESADSKTTEQEILGSMEIEDDSEEHAETAEASTEESTDDLTGEPNNKAPEKDAATKQEEPKQANGPQDLIDRNGNVIAKGGQERRFYESAQKLKTETATLTRKMEQMTAELGAYKEAANVGNQFGLGPDEVVKAGQLMQSFQTDPISTIKALLTQAQSAGYNIEDIGVGTDVSAIRNMINEAINPLVSKHNEEKVTQESNQHAQRIYNDFVTRFPDGEVHTDTLSQLLEEDSNLSLDAAYYKLKNFYSERGLDFSKPIEVLRQEAEQQEVQKPIQNGNMNETLPSGSNIPRVNESVEVADTDASLDDIIRQSMKETGYTFN